MHCLLPQRAGGFVPGWPDWPLVPREEFLMKFRPFFALMGLAAILNSASTVQADGCGGCSSGCRPQRPIVVVVAVEQLVATQVADAAHRT